MTTYDEVYFLFGSRLEVLDSHELDTLTQLIDDGEVDKARSLIYSTDERRNVYAESTI